MREMQSPFRWQLNQLFYALAAIGIFTIVGTMYLGDATGGMVRGFIQSNQFWAGRLATLTELQQAGVDLNLRSKPGAGSSDVAAARERRREAVRRFDAILVRLQDGLQSALTAEDATRVAGQVGDIIEEVNALVAASDAALAAQAGDDGAAATRAMATMDRHLSRITAAAGRLHRLIHELQRASFSEQQAHAAEVQKLKYAYVVIVLAMLAGSIFFGRRIARLSRESEDNRRRYLETLEIREKDLTLATDRLAEKVAERTAELQGSEAKLRSLMQNIPGAVYRCRADWTELFMSDGIEAITGYPAVDFVETRSRSYTGLIHPDDRDMTQAAVGDCIAANAPYSLEYRVIDRDGRTRWVFDRGRPVFDPAGALLFIDGAIFEITDRRRVEEQLRTSQLKFETLLGNIPGACYRCADDADYTMEFISDAIADIAGFPAGDFIGNRARSYASIIHPDDIALVAETVGSALAARRHYTIDYRIVHADGSVRWVYERGQGVFAADGTVLHVDGAIFDVTEKRRMEEELRASQVKFETMLDNIPGACFRCAHDAADTMEFISDAIEQIAGYPASDYIASRVRSYASIIHPDDYPLLLAPVNEAVAERRQYTIEYRILHRDGSIRWVYEKGQGVYADDGTCLHIDGAIFDITERRRMEEELRASQVKFETMLGNIPGACYRCALDDFDTMEFISDAIADISGYPASDFLGNKVRSYSSITHPDDIALGDTALREAVAQRRQYAIEYRIIHRDGSIRWVHERGQGVFAPDGTVLHLDGAIFDVTERHHFEEELKRAETYLTDALESIGEGFILWDADERLVLCNGKYREFFAPSADLMMPGTKFEKIVRAAVARGQYPAAAEDPEAWIQERLRRHRAAEGGFELQLADGRWLRVTDRHTTGGGTVGIRADITERKKVEFELRAANDSLKAAMDKLANTERLATIGQVAATVSHELRNPLGAIRNSMAVIHRLTAGKNLGVERALERADRNVERCASIISDLLEFTRRKELERVPTPIAGWLDALLSEHPLPEGVELLRDLRAAGEAAIDREKFRQAMINLIDNAAQALEDPAWQPGADHPRRITLRAESAGPHLRLTVADTGPGIAADILPRIFEPLFTTKSFGVGLGLPTVRQIVEQHGGTIDLESSPGAGTSFTIWLPRSGEAEQDPASTAPAARGAAA